MSTEVLARFLMNPFLICGSHLDRCATTFSLLPSIASLLTHVLATGWAAFQISHTAGFQSSFNQLITKGACSGVQLLPNYWQDRHNAEVPSLVLNIVALLISVFLTWRLIKVSPRAFCQHLCSRPCLALRLANFQASRCIIDHQPYLQDCAVVVDRHPNIAVFHSCHCWPLD